MSRPLRIDVPDGIYHVTSRGLERRRIVRDQADRRRWTELLGRVALRRAWRVYAWVLMDNHYHLFVRTVRGDLSAGIHDLNGGYVTGFNRRHRRSGPLLQGRFKGILVDSEFHSWELNRYIDLNPVRAGLVTQPEEYRWGSCQYYFGVGRVPEWLAWEEILAQYGRTLRRARQAYKEYVMAGVFSPPESPLRGTVASALLGSAKFIECMRSRLLEGLPDREVPGARELRASIPLQVIEHAVCQSYDVSVELLCTRGRRNNEQRSVAIYLSRRLTARSLTEIGRHFGGVNAQAVSNIEAQTRTRLQGDRRLSKRVCEIESMIKKNVE